MFWKNVLLEISWNSQENTCVRVSFLIKLQPSLQLYLKKDASMGAFLWIYEISKNTFSYRTTPVAASNRWYFAWFLSKDWEQKAMKRKLIE